MNFSRTGLALAAMLAVFSFATPSSAQNAPVGASDVKVTYIRFGPVSEGFLLEPAEPGPNSRVAMVFSHTNRDNYGERPGWFMAQRGYRVMLVNYRGDRDVGDPAPENYLPSISMGISHLRSLPGIEKVILLAHSGGSHLGALYQNVAENGPVACQGPEKVYPCTGKDLEKLAPADGVVLLDPTLGAAHQMTAMDPAVLEEGRDPALDMFTEANGFVAGGKANYSPEFAAKFYAGQATRNAQVIDGALERLKQIEAGKGAFKNDEPFVVRGIGVRALGARPYQTDPTFLAHTKVPHLLLHADGREETVIVPSVREPLTTHPRDLEVLGSMNYDTTVRNFLANAAIRTTAGYAVTPDDIVGVDWASAYSSTPGNAAGITVPTLVLTMSCHYLVVPGEIIFDRLAATDKAYASVEGATHGFDACRPEYGDTAKRTFDFVDRWVGEKGRF
ncbi:hypothetical protein [Mesorhizobium sp. DCY119]|uniref:alpha/beta hydrolase family protein n=1 Tax=Mesorhizobium sp. DCY119 TaxID=2108445 RepID=UPI000E6BDC06|nr:hypothetical protein [Mesorhizobium sp. DCY119]RJG46092.1 hypothetical protein D3Y55_18790 [Mesorhizobium sp. DCY119]